MLPTNRMTEYFKDHPDEVPVKFPFSSKPTKGLDSCSFNSGDIVTADGTFNLDGQIKPTDLDDENWWRN